MRIDSEERHRIFDILSRAEGRLPIIKVQKDMLGLSENVIDGIRQRQLDNAFDNLGAITPVIAQKCMSLWYRVRIFQKQ